MGVSRKETEERLREAFADVTPDLKERILERTSKAQGDVIPFVYGRRRRRNLFTPLLTAAAALLLLVNLSAFAINTDRLRRVDSVIQLDVNPSIQMEVNRIGRVISARALNEDAQRVIGTMDLSGSTTQVAVNAVVGALYQAGYLQQETNSILVSVSGRNAERSRNVQEEVVSDIGATLNAYEVDASILAQSVMQSESLNEHAADYGISAGKALLIDKILAVYPYYTEEELAKFTINELNQLLGEGTMLAGVNVTTVNASGQEPVYTASAENADGAVPEAVVTGAEDPQAMVPAPAQIPGPEDAEDGQAPAGFDIMDYAADGNGPGHTEDALSDGNEGEVREDANGRGPDDAEDGMPDRTENAGSVSENSVSENSVSANSVSANSVSENASE